MTGRRHVVIIGLDGVGVGNVWELEAAMPFTAGLARRSYTVETDVLVPLTAPSWVTISTGVNPGKHGVFDFFRLDADGSPRLVDKSSLERPLVNEIVASMGLPSIALGVHFSYPPFVRRNNLVVSGWTTPRVQVWPPDEAERVRRYVPEGPPRPSSLGEYAESVLEGLERRIELAEYYFRSRDWRLYYIVFPEPDWLFHYLYREIVEGRGGGGRAARRVLEAIDGFIRLAASEAPDNTLLVLCSDHGFTVARRALNGNVLLAKMGLLREKPLPVSRRLALWLARLLPSWLKSRVKYSSLALIAQRAGVGDVFRMGGLPIDYTRSKAFMTVAYTVYVNPLLDEEERAQVRRAVYEAFSRYREFFERIGFGEEVFWGPYAKRAPDIVLVPREGYTVTTRLMYRSIVEDGRWYVHSNRGLLVLHGTGPDNPVVEEKDTATTMDIVPTVLAYLGLPLDPDMDGKPLIKPQERAGWKRYEFIARLGKRLSGLKARQ